MAWLRASLPWRVAPEFVWRVPVQLAVRALAGLQAPDVAGVAARLAVPV